MKKLKVLHLIEALGSGGAEHMLHTNLKFFDLGSVESTVTMVYSGADFWKKPIEDLGVSVTSLDCMGPYDIPSGVAKLRQQIKADPPALIHTHLWTANIIGRLAGNREKIPVISSIHNPEYEPPANKSVSVSRALKLSVAKRMDQFTSRWCSRMIAVSKFVRESTAARLGFPIDRIDVLYNPVDVDRLSQPANRAAVCMEADVPLDSEILLNVSRLSPQKGLIHAIRAMPAVLEQRPKARLLSIGSNRDAGYVTAVRREIELLGLQNTVHLLGEKRNVNEYLSACDVFIFPSEFEGLGIALAEAMAAGRACVASDIHPLDEFVSSEDNGVLVPFDQADLLASAIIDLLQHHEKRRNLGLKAKETAIEFFEPRKAARQLTNIYQSCFKE